jgi:hypothetical protein
MGHPSRSQALVWDEPAGHLRLPSRNVGQCPGNRAHGKASRPRLRNSACGARIEQRRPAAMCPAAMRPTEPPLAGGLGDLARLDAGRADVETLPRPGHDRVDGLDVGVPATAGAAVRVRDVVAEARPFTADVADGRHGSLHWVGSVESDGALSAAWNAKRNKAAREAYPKAPPNREPSPSPRRAAEPSPSPRRAAEPSPSPHHRRTLGRTPRREASAPPARSVRNVKNATLSLLFS